MKGFMIFILLLLVLGLYFVPNVTKSLIRTTGHATLEASKGVVEEIKNSQEIKEAYIDFKENVTKTIKDKLKTNRSN